MFPWRVEEKDLMLYGTQYISHDIWARTLGMSEETIRSQIRAIDAKAHSSDKAGLTRLVLSLG